MKKAIITVILILCACFIVYGQSSSVDLILVLDTSQGMSSSYENVNNYLTGDFLKEFLRVGDTFHLIAFSDSQRLDVARRINGFGDVETIVGRMLLQYPVEAGRNVQSALSFAEQYASSLPSRPKKIVLVTLAGTDAANLVSATKQRLGSGTTLDYIEVTPGRPLTNLPASGRSAVISAPVSSSPSGAAPAASPGTASNTAASSGTAGTASNAPSSAVTPAAGTASVPADNTAGIIPPPAVSAADTTTTTSSGITPETQTPSQVSQTPASTSGTGNVSGQTTASQTNAPSAPSASDSSGSSLASSLPLIIGLIIAALLILGLIIFFVTRKLSSSPNRVMSEAAAPETAVAPKPVDHSKDLAKFAAASAPARRTTPYDDHSIKDKPTIKPDGPLMLNLFVQEQNTNIGKRNIHSIKSGYKFTVGGGKNDDFLIFLVPLPAHIGEVRRDGSQLTFIPHKAKYFPDIGSNEVKDCLNKIIRIVSDKQYEMRFHFEMYEDPLLALNRILTSVHVPG